MFSSKTLLFIVATAILSHDPTGSLYLYTTELGTTPPPELCTSRLLYDRFRQNRLRYYMINRTKVHHWLWWKMVLLGKQEYCTSQKTGVLYNTEIRNIVHHWKQEFCTTQKTGILYNTKNRNIVHHLYDERETAMCTCMRQGRINSSLREDSTRIRVDTLAWGMMSPHPPSHACR